MKKLASILLLGILSFNWIGYRMVSHILEQEASAKLEARLDNNEYDQSQLIEITVPIEMPYLIDWKEFERYDGEIEINGVHYKYVKRKIENGSLILLCLPNKTKMNLQSTRDDFFKMVNDLQTSSKNSKDGSSSSLKNIITEYWKEENNWKISSFSIPSFQYSSPDQKIYSSFLSETPGQPPEVNG